jgi:hypothetical protein
VLCARIFAEDPDSKYTYTYNLLSQNLTVDNAGTAGVAQVTFSQNFDAAV